VSTSVGEKPLAKPAEAPPDWSPVAESPDGRRTGRGAALRRAALGVVVIGVLWWLGHELAATLLIVVLGLVTTVSLLVPSAARAIGAGEQAVERVAGRVISTLLMSVVELLVFTPLSLVLRLVGHDPLALGSSSDAPTLWRPHVDRRGKPLYRRPFAYDRLPKAVVRRTRLGWLRVVLVVLALVVVLDVALGAGLDALRDEAAPAPQNLLTAPDVPAGRHEPWRAELSDEITDSALNKTYDPYLGWRVVDFHGRYVNVSHATRRSYEPAGAGDRRAVQVYFFGGSTMFGAFQRDGHTIPSEFARLAQADGLTVRVVNKAQLAYMNWQEVLLFESLLSGGAKPDLSVFYDGANELLSQFADGPHRAPTHLEARTIEERLAQAEQGSNPSDTRALYHSWREVSVLYGLGRELGVLPDNEAKLRLQSPWAGDQKDHPERRGADAAYVHSRGVELASRLAASYGLETAFVWQPFLYSKRIVPGERPVLGWLASDPDAWRRAGHAARARLAPGVIDLSEALDAERAPVMYDLAHTNELGARIAARALYRKLRPALVRLAREKSG
jgi:hypothetical protein